MTGTPADRGTPTTDERLRAHTIGELRPYADKVVIAEYDPAWPRRFEREAARIGTALGASALTIDHIGSTSVPGLAAKPIIDIAMAVADSSDEDAYVPAVERAGYELRIREADWHEHRVFRARTALGHGRDVNLHVYSAGCVLLERYRVFRDRLRANDDDRARYERTKRELAARDWKYVQNYADAKTAVVDEIVRAAGEPTGACLTY